MFYFVYPIFTTLRTISQGQSELFKVEPICADLQKSMRAMHIYGLVKNMGTNYQHNRVTHRLTNNYHGNDESRAGSTIYYLLEHEVKPWKILFSIQPQDTTDRTGCRYQATNQTIDITVSYVDVTASGALTDGAQETQCNPAHRR